MSVALGCDRPSRVGAGGATRPARSLASAPPPPAASSTPPPANPPPPPPPARLEAEGPFADLPVEGHQAAVISIPIGAEGKKPVLIATHGNFDRPEWQCEVWRGIVENRAFILCPRGVVRPDSPSRDDIRFTYPSNAALEAEIDAGLRALQDRFPDFVDPGPAVYTGFSLGAIMGVSIAARAPSRTPRLVLIEGGHDKWTPATVRAFAEGGGLRVLFVCSQGFCASDARLAAARVQRAGVETRVVKGPDVGHRYDGPTAEETKKALAWVLEGDDRWR